MRDTPRVLCLTGHALTAWDLPTIVSSPPVNTIYQPVFLQLGGLFQIVLGGNMSHFEGLSNAGRMTPPAVLQLELYDNT